MNKYLNFWNIVTIIIAVIFSIFIVYPLLYLFVSAFKSSETGKWTLENFIIFFSKKYYYKSLINSFTVTISVTILTIIIGTMMAYFMTIYQIRGKRFLEILIIISMMSPAFIGAYSWILLLGRNGVITKSFETLGIKIPNIYGFAGILLVFTLKLYPFIFMYVSGALGKMDSSLIEASESLGASSFKKITSIILPLITPTILAGSLIVFMNALSDFGTPMLIGEGYRTIPTLIYSEFINEVGGNANFSAAMATLMVFITTIMFLTQKYYINKKSFSMKSINTIKPKKLKGIKAVSLYAFLYIIVIASILPQITVIYTSFLKTNRTIFIKGYSLDSYKTIFDSFSSAIKNTYLYGFASILIVIIISVLLAYVSTKRKNIITDIIDTISMLPYIISGSILGIVLLLAFNKPPLVLSGTPIIIIIALSIRRLPYTLRSSSAILYQIDNSYEEASISLGASPIKTFYKITLIMMLPGVLSGAVLSWITIINELSSSVILYVVKSRTMSIAIYQAVVQGTYGPAAALATILTITTVISIIIFFKLTGKKEISL